MKGLNVISLNTVGLNTVPLNSVDLNSFASSGKGKGSGLASGLVASYRCYDKTNDDADRDILKDLTGKGHDISLKNFAFSGGSGYGKYIQDFSQFALSGSNPNISIETNYNKISVSYKEGVNLGIYITKSNLIWKSFKVKVTTSDYNNEEIGFSYYSGKVNKEIPFVINGITEIIPPTDQDTVNYAGLFIFNKSDKAGQFTIEQIPEYQDALVFDGIDDLGINENMPLLDDYTFIIKRKILTKTGIVASYRDKDGNIITDYAQFWFEYVQFKKSYSFNKIIEITQKNIDNSISYQSKEKYNNKDFKPYYPFIRGGKLFTLGALANNSQHCNMAFYCAYLFDRSLTPEEIELFIKTNIDKDYTLPNN